MYGYPRFLMATALVLSGCHAADDAASAGESIIGEAGDTSTETIADPDDGDGDGGETTGGPPVCDPPSPYMGGWDIGCCQDEVPPQNGWAPGQVGVGTIMPDYTFTDQFGEAIRLYDFCHDAVWFEYVALW